MKKEGKVTQIKYLKDRHRKETKVVYRVQQRINLLLRKWNRSYKQVDFIVFKRMSK